MRVEYQEYILEMEGEKGSHELSFVLYHYNPEEQVETMLWNGILMGLWEDDYARETVDLRRCWNLYEEGDYFQQTICRVEKEILPHISFTAVFHEIIINNRARFDLIINLFSSSDLEWLNLGYKIYDFGSRFWVKQEENGLAEWIESEKRYKAILEQKHLKL